jgi:hypothetical protein
MQNYRVNSKTPVWSWRFWNGIHEWWSPDATWIRAAITPPNHNSIVWHRDYWLVQFAGERGSWTFDTLEEAKVFVGKHLGIDASGLSLSG